MPTWGIGLAIVIMVSIVISSAASRSSLKVCEKLVPFMAIAYAWGCIVIIGMNWEYVARHQPHLRVRVHAEGGVRRRGGLRGDDGAAVRLRARPVLEQSRLGSAPIVASAASTRNPARASCP